jgi:hypothetical protein
MRIQKLVPVAGAIALAASSVFYIQHFSSPAKPGVSPLRTATSTTDAGPQLWHCGMHPQVILDHAGVCPICGMPLTPLSGDRHQHGQVTIDPTIGKRSADHVFRGAG